MADLPLAQQWDVAIPVEVDEMWLDVRIQEIKSRIARTSQDVEDLINGKVKALKANLKMLQLTLEDLEKKKASITIK